MVSMADERPILMVLRRRPLLGAVFGQREGGPIVGALLRMGPEARGRAVADLAVSMLSEALSQGVARGLARIIELNVETFLGRRRAS